MAHLLPVLEDSPLWEDFLDILTQFNNEHVLNQARALAALRIIDDSSSDEVVRETIRDLGINLPNEVLDLNLEKLRQFFYHLPNFEESLGNPKYQEFISFILDSGFEVVPLWTADFKTFSEEPEGDKLEDGGDWYKTSHVRVLPQWGKLQKAFDLTIDPDLERQLKSKGVLTQSEMYVGKSAEELGQDVLQEVLEYKVIDLFFRFAPIELVLERLIYTIKVESDLYVSGHVVHENKDYLNLTQEKLIKVVFPRPKKVYAARPIILYATAFFENNIQKQVPISFDIIEGKDLVEKEAPTSIVFKDPTNATPLKVKFRAIGRSAEHVMLLMPSTSAETPKTIEIKIKERLDENQSYPLKVFGEFDSMRAIDDIDQVEWSINSDNAKIIDNVLYVDRIHADEEVTITAEYWDQNNKYHVVEKNITLVDSLKEAIPVSMEITGADSITQGNKGLLRCLVHYSDDSTVQVNPLWECANSHVDIEPDGTISCEKVQGDFSSVVKAALTVEGVTLKAEKKITFIFERLVIFRAEVIGIDTMVENTGQQLYCIAHWCFVEDLQKYIDGDVTEDQIKVGETQVEAQWSLGSSSSALNFDLIKGYLTVPSTNHNASVVVNATITQVSASPITVSKFISVVPKEDLISHIDLVCSPDIFQDNVYPVKPVAVFESGKSIDLLDVNNVNIAFDIATEEDTPSDRSNLYMIDNKIYFFGNISGLVKLSCAVDYQHTLADGSDYTQTLGADKLLSVIPKIVKSDGIEVVIPSTNVLPDSRWFILEESRLFLKTIVSFEDGTTKALEPNWVNELVIPDDSEYNSPIDIVNMEVSLREMVEVLTGHSAEYVYMLMARHIYGHKNSELVGNTLTYQDDAGTQFQIDLSLATDWSIISNMEELSGYPEFSDISLRSDLEAKEYRTLLQCGRVTEDTEVVLTTIYFKEETENEIIVLNREEESPNTILSSAVRGPREFLANVESVSYALYVNFDDGGPEYAVSNDWSIKVNNKRSTLDALGWEHSNVPDEDLDLKYPDSMIVEIDQDGYVYPKHNIQFEFTVSASYDDGFVQFTKSMDSVAYRANLELKGIEIVGPDTVQDIGDSSLVNEGVPHFQYIARLYLNDNTVEDVVGEWTLRLDQSNKSGDPDGIVLDSSTGKLYVKEQTLDQHVILDVYYERQYDTHLESVKAQLPVHVVATRSIQSIEISGPASSVDDSEVQLNVTATRSNGQTSDVTALCDWFILDANSDTSIEDGRVSLGKFNSDKQVYVGATLKQGTNTLEATFDFEVKGQSTLNGISISGMTNIRDDSDIQLEAVVFRGVETVTDYTSEVPNICNTEECVTEESYWEVVQGSDIATVDKGRLRVKASTESKAVVVQVTYTERGATVRDSFSIYVNSSMPRYGVQEENFDIAQVLDFETIDSPVAGGSFAINVDTADAINVRGFFAHRKELGIAHIVESRGRQGYGSWVGPVEVVKQYDNVTTSYYVYSTRETNFGIGEFAYYYKSQNS